MNEQATFFSRYRYQLILGLLLLIYLFNGICYLQSQSITSDEASFFDYAIRFLKGHPERVQPVTDNSKMPVSVLNAIPRIAENVLRGAADKNDGGFSDIMHGRYVTLLISMFTILLVYKWSSELYGKHAGIFSAFLMVMCPNNLANSGLVTTDSYSVVFLLLSMYLLWKFNKLQTTKYFVLFSLAVAFSQLVKQSLFHLYVLVPLLLTVVTLINKEKISWKLLGKRLLIFSLINLIVINAGYYFSGTFTSLGDYHFMSNLFQGLQHVFPSALPMPFPKPFVDGLDMAKYYDQLGGGFDPESSFGNVTILNESKTGGGFWYYYFVSIFYKTPIPILIFAGWAKWYAIRKRNVKDFVNNELFLLFPVLYFIVIMSFFYQTQCGLRHLIFIYPLLFVLSGMLVKYAQEKYQRILLLLLSLWLVISVSIYWRNYFPYTNEFILNKTNAYTKVGSSNLEFQQGYYFAESFLRKHPEVHWAPEQEAKGKFIISLEDYLDIWSRKQFEWIKKYKPTGNVAYNYLLIEVP